MSDEQYATAIALGVGAVARLICAWTDDPAKRADIAADMAQFLVERVHEQEAAR